MEVILDLMWIVTKYLFGGTFFVCLIMGLLDNDDRKHYDVEMPDSYYKQSQRKQWRND
mgnify:FL=1